MTRDLEDRDRTEYNRAHAGKTRTEMAEIGMDWIVNFFSRKASY